MPAAIGSSNVLDGHYRKAAIARYEANSDINIDELQAVSRRPDKGAWVTAYVWVSNEDLEEK